MGNGAQWANVVDSPRHSETWILDNDELVYPSLQQQFAQNEKIASEESKEYKMKLKPYNKKQICEKNAIEENSMNMEKPEMAVTKNLQRPKPSEEQ